MLLFRWNTSLSMVWWMILMMKRLLNKIRNVFVQHNNNTSLYRSVMSCELMWECLIPHVTIIPVSDYLKSLWMFSGPLGKYSDCSVNMEKCSHSWSHVLLCNLFVCLFTSIRYIIFIGGRRHPWGNIFAVWVMYLMLKLC